MRTIGIDLALTSAHKAVVADAQGRYLTPVFSFHTTPADLARLLVRARDGAPDEPLQVVMEPTGMAWFPIAVFFARQAVPVYLVNSQEVADLRRYYQRHAKSDRIDTRVLVRLPVVNPDKLHRLHVSSATTLACQRACKQLDRLDSQIVALKNRLQAVDRFAWPGLEPQVFAAPFAPATWWFRQHWYDPRTVVQAGAQAIRRDWQASGLDATDAGGWTEGLVRLADDVLALYGADSPFLDFATLHAEVLRDQRELEHLEDLHHQLRMQVVRPLYRQIHPSRMLETLKGVGQDSAAVYASFVGEVTRFPSVRDFRGWSGLVPASAQSGGSEAKGQHITQAGPDLVKKYAFIDAESARQWDPQIAAIYYTQMVQRGKHHNQAVCACATHLLDRVLTVLRTDAPYELRDVDGTPVSVAEARAIVLERYRVPAEVRRRTTRHQRQRRNDQRAEQTYERESRLR
ncbi:MAG TPA: IS110 family transposase [Herpetosiphonaceae bacterium]|nr:IS110 family transposase [Herpetosiphonaceae bacterium]